MGEFDTAAAKAEEAIEIGRAHRADFALIARAFERIGTARYRQQRLDEALKAYNSALSEHRTPAVLKKVPVPLSSAAIAAQQGNSPLGHRNNSWKWK